MDRYPLSLPSPRVAFVGRHDSGKTTLITHLIARLVSLGMDVGSIKHHGHTGFDIDIPGKDSYRHREAGANEVVIAAPGRVARIDEIQGELACDDIVASMPGHDIVLIEGYREGEVPSIEVMRAGNPRDVEAARRFKERARAGLPLCTTEEVPLPTDMTIAVVTDIPDAIVAAGIYCIPTFRFEDIDPLCDLLKRRIMRQPMSIVVQAGGESKRMGANKATMPFLGRPLISRVVGRLLPLADELIVTTNDPSSLSFLCDESPDDHIVFARDIMPQRGTLPGIATALDAATYEYVAIVACDMVFASPAVLAAENAEMAFTQADIVVPKHRHGIEPLHAVYRKSTCLPVAYELVRQGDLSARSLIERVQSSYFLENDILRSDPDGRYFVNINTPDELYAVEQGILADGS